MKLIRLHGVIDRIAEGVAAIVPHDGSREVYVLASAIPDAREGFEVDLLVTPGKNPNQLCLVYSKSTSVGKKPRKSASFSRLNRGNEESS